MRSLQAAAALAVIAFWAPNNAYAILICKGDVNLDAVRDGADIRAFADAVISGSGASQNATWAADMDGSSAVDLADFGPFVDCLLGVGGSACTTCFDPDIIDGINIANGEHRIFVTRTTYNGNLGGYLTSWDSSSSTCMARGPDHYGMARSNHFDIVVTGQMDQLQQGQGLGAPMGPMLLGFLTAWWHARVAPFICIAFRTGKDGLCQSPGRQFCTYMWLS